MFIKSKIACLEGGGMMGRDKLIKDCVVRINRKRNANGT